MDMSELPKIEPYSPCPCGSGKKYKFCCYQKARERETAKGPSFFSSASSPDMDGAVPEGVLVGDLAEGRRFCDRGLRLMAAGKFEQAIPLFRQSSAAAPFVYTAANNLAVCLFATGRLDEAIRTQAESLKAVPFPNPFGLSNLVTFHTVNGDEAAAQRYLGEALACGLPSADACVKVCEVLARFKRHREILGLADRSGYGDDPGVCFFTGVAAANLSDRTRALRDLRRMPLGHYKAEMARRYLECLGEKTTPHTVRGDWPYLFAHEICPFEVARNELEKDKADWLSRRVVVDFCEAILNESSAEPENGIRMLIHAKHPEAVELLWIIAKGTFGPDSLRMEAIQELDARGKLDRQQGIDVFLNGKRGKVAVSGNPAGYGLPVWKATAGKAGEAVRQSRRSRIQEASGLGVDRRDLPPRHKRGAGVLPCAVQLRDQPHPPWTHGRGGDPFARTGEGTSGIFVRPGHIAANPR